MTRSNYRILQDGSVIDRDDRVVYFSIDRFINEVAAGKCCFICGADPSKIRFNDEHVIPNWILRKYDLHDQYITLANQAKVNYGEYKIPCCQACNNWLSQTYETQISSAILSGYNNFANYLANKGIWHLFTYMNLLFIKTHLKDVFLHFFLDRREPEAKIAELYDWESLHHIHCITRTFFTKPKINKRLLGTVIVLPIRNIQGGDPFDFADNTLGKGIMIQLGEIGIISILNDSCGAMNLYQKQLDKIKPDVSTLQLREILTHLVFLNLNLKNRPIYFSNVNATEYSIDAVIPDMVEFDLKSEITFGDLLYSNCGTIIERIDIPEKSTIINESSLKRLIQN